jgi:colanic acid/amylovoran biosynthesis glycosyltransferase
MTRVIYVSHVFPWVTQTFTTREVELVRRHGIDVTVIAFREPPADLLDDRARSLVAITTYIPQFTSPDFWLPVLRVFARRPLRVAWVVARGASASYRARTTLRLRVQGILDALRGTWIAGTIGGDDIHVHAEFAENAATAALVVHELTGNPYSFKSHSSFNPQLLEVKARDASFVALATEFDRDFYFASVPQERIVVNRLGVESLTGLERPIELPDRVRVLCVATLAEKKGHRYLVDAARLMRERGVQLDVSLVGDGPLRAELQQQIRELGLEAVVKLRPYVSHSELAPLYDAADIFVLPAVVTESGDRDGLPVVLMEAIAAGCIVVSTPVSGIPELVIDRVSGLLVPERDAVALAAAIEEIAGDAQLRQQLRSGGMSVLQDRFDLERNVRELAHAFDQAGSVARSSTSR